MSEIVLSDVGEFFPPAQHGAVDTLLSMHGAMRERIDQLAELMSGELGGAVPYFIQANNDDGRRGGLYSTEKLFDPEGAIKALDADYWRRALDLTGVRELMPQDMRGTWDKHLRAQVVEILEALGGVQSAQDRDDFHFGYDPSDALNHLVVIGTMPDEVTHQYYPTPDALAQRLVATLGPDDGVAQYLEPSAGRGAIAAHLPKDRTTCVEVADLNAIILRSKGFEVEQADFVHWAKRAPKFDRVAMNPPFSQGRAEAHLQAAAALLAPGGRLSAILPASMHGKALIPGAAIEGWSEVIAGAFPGVSVAVAIYTASMPA